MSEDEKERTQFIDQEVERWQNKIDEIRILRMNTRLQVMGKWQDFTIAMGQVSFGLAGVIGPLVFIADRTPKYPWAFYLGFTMFLTNGILIYFLHQSRLATDSHDARQVGLDPQLSLVRIRNAARKASADPISNKLFREYQKVKETEVARLTSQPSPPEKLTFTYELMLGLLILGCCFFVSELWPWNEKSFIAAVMIIFVGLFVKGVADYRSALRRETERKAIADLIKHEERESVLWLEGFQSGRQ